MARRHRSSSSQFPSYPSTGRTRRRKTPTQKLPVQEQEQDDDEEDDYNDESSQGNEYEQSEEEPEEDDDVDSESFSNAPPDDPSFSQSYIPETPSISASGSPNNPSSQPNSNASSSYVKIAPLPIFSGTTNESPVTYLSRFNKVCRANNASSIDMLMKIFPVTLEDEAALWYDLNIEPYCPSLTWDEIKLSFLQAYHKFETIEELRAELMGTHQGEDECVRSYFLRLQWVLKRWDEHELSDDLIKGIFVDGLREEFHDWVLMQKPNSLNEALRLAFGFEELRSVRGKKGTVVPICGFCKGLHEEYDCKVREGMREVWRKSKRKEWSDEIAMDLLRLLSVGESSGQGKVEEGEKGGESVKKSQCNCSKHQCRKKKLLRNSSIESRISHRD